MQTLKERLSIIISVLAFCISSISFYLSALRPADPHIIGGSSVYIFHDVTGRASVAMPLSLSNNGARVAVIQRLALLVRHPEQKDGYLLAPYAFQRINDKGEPQDESMAGSLVIPGRSQITKQILFKASQADDKFSIASPGRYGFTLLAFLGGETSPMVTDAFGVELSELDANQLMHWYELGVTNSVVVEREQWKEWRPGFLSNPDSMLGR
jgi:hypothetical protein